MRRIDAVVGALARAMIWGATAAGVSLSAFVALSAFMRYLVGAPFAFTEEVVGLLFSAMVFLALPYCTYGDRHIRVTLVRDSLPSSWRRWTALASTLFTVAFCLIYGCFAFEFAWTSLELNARSDIGRIPLWPWMAAMPFACLVMGIAALLHHARGAPADGGGTGA